MPAISEPPAPVLRRPRSVDTGFFRRNGKLFFVRALAAAAALAALLFVVVCMLLELWLYASLAMLAAVAAAAAAAAADDLRSVGVTKDDADLLPDRGSLLPLAACADKYCLDARLVLIGGGGGFDRDMRLSGVP